MGFFSSLFGGQETGGPPPPQKKENLQTYKEAQKGVSIEEFEDQEGEKSGEFVGNPETAEVSEETIEMPKAEDESVEPTKLEVGTADGGHEALEKTEEASAEVAAAAKKQAESERAMNVEQKLAEREKEQTEALIENGEDPENLVTETKEELGFIEEDIDALEAQENPPQEELRVLYEDRTRAAARLEIAEKALAKKKAEQAA